MSSFGPVASFYDDLMETVPYRMWISYYLLLLSRQDAHPKRILDVCCGTGTCCELLDAEGFEVAGFDLSAPMIEMAREKARLAMKDIRYEVFDAAEFDMGETYDSAYSFFDSLNYITDVDRLGMAFGRVAAHLRPGGSFIFDLNTAYAFEASLFDQQNMSRKAKVKYKWQSEWDPESLIIKVDMSFWRRGKEYHETHVQRAHRDDEVRDLLGRAGFVDVQCFNSYTLDPPRYKSDRVHYAAIRS